MRNGLVALVKSRRFWLGATPWVLVIVFIANVLVARWHKSLAAQRRDNLLAATLPLGSDHSIRYDWSTGENLDQYWPHIPAAAALLVGMSQMYAINESQPGDKTISEHMDDKLSARGQRVFGLAAPNLCNEEAALLLLASLSELRAKPRVFVYGVCFDKFRNLDLRPGYLTFLRNHPKLQAAWREAAARNMERFPRAAAKMLRSVPPDYVGSEARPLTAEERIETGFARWLPMVAAKKDINANIQMQLFLFRNWLFRIKPTSKRPVLQGRYELNKEFLGLMVDQAQRNGVKIAFYAIPLNPLAENPYIPEQYADFKTWLEGFCREKGVAFANLENQVPSQYWGEFMGGPDFKHFKEAGHRITAQSLIERFGSVWAGPR
jgi:hypothetical protein